MHASILALALLTPAQGRSDDWDMDREVVNYSRVRDRGYDRRSGGYGGGYVLQPAPYYGGNGFSAQFQGPRGGSGYIDYRGSGSYSGGGFAPQDPLVGQFAIDARFRREPRRGGLLRFLLCGPEREPRFTGTVDVRRLR